MEYLKRRHKMPKKKTNDVKAEIKKIVKKKNSEKMLVILKKKKTIENIK